MFKTVAGVTTGYLVDDRNPTGYLVDDRNPTGYLVDDRNPTGYVQVLDEVQVQYRNISRAYVYGLEMAHPLPVWVEIHRCAAQPRLHRIAMILRVAAI